MARIKTAAERYLERAKKIEILTPVTCETCGETWECRKYDLQFWIESGTMPADLAAKVLEAYKATPNGAQISEADIAATLDETQLMRSIEFTSKVVKMTAVNPSIGPEADPANNVLGFDQVMKCCYQTLRDWQMRGGGKAGDLGSFHSE
jgi:hypothetical protein